MRISMPWLKYSLAVPMSLAVMAMALPSEAATPRQASQSATPSLAGAAQLSAATCDPSPRAGKKSSKHDCVTLHLGKKRQARVAAGDRIVLKGVVRRQDARRTVLIQELQGGGRLGIVRKTKGRWKTIKKVKARHSLLAEEKGGVGDSRLPCQGTDEEVQGIFTGRHDRVGDVADDVVHRWRLGVRLRLRQRHRPESATDPQQRGLVDGSIGVDGAR